MTITATSAALTPPHTLSSARQAHALLAQARELIDRANALLSAPPESAEPDDPSALIAAAAEAEQITAAASAAQMRASVSHRRLTVERQRAQGVRREQLGRGAADEIALARRISPARASRELATARVLVESLPRTMALLAAGEVSAWAADEVARAALTLDDADRDRLDEDLAPRLTEVTARRAGVLARARAGELDQQAALRRMRHEVSQRHVSVRPISDTMVRISATVPTAQGVAMLKTLDTAATVARAAGDPRTRGQVMADEMFSRTTGLSRIEDADVEIQLLMTDAALLAADQDSATLEGQPIPASIARALALGDGASDARRWIRRLYTDPVTGQLSGADARRRLFTGQARRFVTLRDQHCRTPWCEAPIRHLDHVERHADGGPTTVDNAAGRCERCNYVREMPGWSAAMDSGRTLRIITPSGRTYTSDPPPLRRVSDRGLTGAPAPPVDGGPQYSPPAGEEPPLAVLVALFPDDIPDPAEDTS